MMPIGMVDQVAKWTEDHAVMLCTSLTMVRDSLIHGGMNPNDEIATSLHEAAIWLFDTFAPPEVKNARSILEEAEAKVRDLLGGFDA